MAEFSDETLDRFERADQAIAESIRLRSECRGLFRRKVEAIAPAGTIIRDQARLMRVGEDWRIEVTDETGSILFRLDFQITASAAVQLPISDDN